MSVEGYVIDIESNGFFFQADKIWTLVVKDLKDPMKRVVINPFKDPQAYNKFKEFHDSYTLPLVVGHYILGFDMFVLLKLLGVEFSVGPDSLFNKPCVFVDTLYMSQYIDPDVDGHSLADWGDRIGLGKIDYFEVAKEKGIIPSDAKRGDEFSVWAPEMDEYCERDVDVNIKLFWHLWKLFNAYYEFGAILLPSHYRCGQKAFFLMSCQEFAGWKFDTALAEKLTHKIEGMMKEIEDDVLPKLPPRKLKKGEIKDYSMPMKPFKKNLEYSSHMLNFIEKHNGIVLGDNQVEFYGEVYLVGSQKLLNVNLPMEMKDGDDLKDWFLSQGWKPTLWNYKRGADGKPLRDDKGKLIPTSPKMQEAGKICTNLTLLDGEIPKQIVKFLSLRNRLSVLTGWMENWRLAMDGRIGASRTGITPTHRQKHSVVVNVPKASDKVLLGKEFRSLWIAEEGNVIAAGDAAALEGRVMGHYTWKYDQGKTAEEILSGDPHSKNAKAFFAEETRKFDIESEEFNKDHPEFKPFRDKSKNGFYAVLYGCAAAKLASTLGLPESKGEIILKRFWEANPAIAALKDNVTKFWETKGGKKWLPGIDGRRLITRKKSALLNTLFQSCGAIAMDYACCYLDSWLGGIKFDKDFKPYYLYKGRYVVRRIGFFHDEVEFECPEEVGEEIARMIERAIEMAGKHLKLAVPLAGEGKVGLNWKETH